MQKFPLIQLQELLNFVLDNPRSSFYTKHLSKFCKLYPKLSNKNWSKVPVTTRTDIQTFPYWDRIFVPESEVEIIRNTYGSSGDGIIITPRFYFGDFEEPFVTEQMDRIMSFFSSGLNDFPRIKTGGVLLFGDCTDLHLCARLCKLGSINSLYTLPYIAATIAPYLKKEGVLENIKAIQITGERCSPLQFKKIKEVYPNAIVFGNYASSETREAVALACRHSRHSKNGMVLESLPEYYIELIHPETKEIIEEYDVSGEILLTTLVSRTPFPLIRYQTGDIGVYTKRDCSCEQNRRGLEILGRKSVYPVRMLRGELSADKIENALANVDFVKSNYFEVHYTEVDTGEQALPEVVLKILIEAKQVDLHELSKYIAEKIFVYPNYTYADGVRDNIYTALKIEILKHIPAGKPGKPKAPLLIRHDAESKNIQDSMRIAL